MALIYQPSKRIFCGWFEPLKSTTYSEYPKKEPRLHVLWFGEGSQFSAALYADMLEEVQEYDPHAWNKYPEVEPPKDVWMRCENVYGSEPERLERFAARYTSQYEDGEWVDAWFSNGLRRDVTSFRPWDEEDEE